MKNVLNRQITLLILTVFISACGGDKTFNDYARAGDTIAVAGGYQQNFNLSNISIDIIQNNGTPTGILVDTIPQGSPAIRASVNLYPDPLSGLIVSRETGIEMTPFADTYENQITGSFTGGDKDWYQTTVFADLPQTLAIGIHRIVVKNSLGESFQSNVEIIPGTGIPSTLTAYAGTNLSPDMIAGISRLPHYTVDFTGTTIPYAIEITLSHDPDSIAGGTGKTFAVNPIGYKKNMSWTDDGTTLKAILSPTTSDIPDSIIDYKFYVTGGISNLTVTSVESFDINGNSIFGVNALTTYSN